MIGALIAQRAARAVFDAMNHRDLNRVMHGVADDAVLEIPGHSPASGRFEGRPQIEAWFRRWWDEASFLQFTVRHVAVTNVLAVGGTNVLLVEWDAVERNREGRSYRFNGISRLSVKAGKVVQVREYFFDPDLLTEFWAGVSGPATPTTVPV